MLQSTFFRFLVYTYLSGKNCKQIVEILVECRLVSSFSVNKYCFLQSFCYSSEYHEVFGFQTNSDRIFVARLKNSIGSYNLYLHKYCCTYALVFISNALTAERTQSDEKELSSLYIERDVPQSGRNLIFHAIDTQECIVKVARCCADSGVNFSRRSRAGRNFIN